MADAPNQSLVGNFIPVQAKKEPLEGRGIVPFNFALTPINYSVAQGFDLSALRVSQVCSLYVDNTQNPQPLILIHGAANTMITIPAGGGGFIPTTSTQAGYFLNVATTKAPVAVINIPVTLYNYENPPSLFGSQIIERTTTITTDTLPNLFYNPACQIAQRGPTGTFASGANTYTVGLDGWYMKGANGTGTLTWLQGGSLGIGQSSLQIKGAAGTIGVSVARRVIAQDISPFMGQSVLLQFKIANNTGTDLTPNITIKHPLAFNDFSAVSVADYGSNVQTCINGAVTQCAIVLTLPSNLANGCQLDINIPGLSSNTQTVSISEIDLSLAGALPSGLVQTPPLPRLKAFATDLYDCQFFYDTSYPLGYAPGAAATDGLVYVGFGQISNVGTTAGLGLRFARKMFKVPTFNYWSKNGLLNRVTTAQGNISGTWSENAAINPSLIMLNIDTQQALFIPVANLTIYAAYLHYAVSAEP